MVLLSTSIEQYFSLVLFIMLYLLYHVVVTFECVDQTLMLDPSSESYCQYMYFPMALLTVKELTNINLLHGFSEIH